MFLAARALPLSFCLYIFPECSLKAHELFDMPGIFFLESSFCLLTGYAVPTINDAGKKASSNIRTHPHELFKYHGSHLSMKLSVSMRVMHRPSPITQANGHSLVEEVSYKVRTQPAISSGQLALAPALKAFCESPVTARLYQSFRPSLSNYIFVDTRV